MNPAERLLTVLNRLPEKAPDVRAAWREALCVEDNHLAIMRGILELEGIVREVETGLARARLINAKTTISTIAMVRQLYLVPGLTQHWPAFWPAVLAARTSVSLISEVFESQLIFEPEIPKLTINSLIEGINDLRDVVDSSEVHPAVKTFLFEQLEEMRRALNHYHIYGLRSLIDALGIAAARLSLHPIAARAEQKADTKPIMEKMRAWLKTATAAFGAAEKAGQALETGTKLIDWFRGNPGA